jgi:hypothetical protein
MFYFLRACIYPHVKQYVLAPKKHLTSALDNLSWSISWIMLDPTITASGLSDRSLVRNNLHVVLFRYMVILAICARSFVTTFMSLWHSLSFLTISAIVLATVSSRCLLDLSWASSLLLISWLIYLCALLPCCNVVCINSIVCIIYIAASTDLRLVQILSI